MSRRLFIEETTPTSTGCGVREIWEPSDAEMAELGWARAPNVTVGASDSTGSDMTVFLVSANAPAPDAIEELRRMIINERLPKAPAPDEPVADEPGAGSVIGHTDGGEAVHAMSANKRPLADPFANVNGSVVKPCSLHAKFVSSCRGCMAWLERHAGGERVAEPPKAKKPSDWIRESARNRLVAGYGVGEPALQDVIAYLDERLGGE